MVWCVAEVAVMSCFCMSNGQVAVAPMDEAIMKKGADIKSKVVGVVGHKEEAHKDDVPHKTHKSTGGSQAHSFVRHLIHTADARCGDKALELQCSAPAESI